MKIQVLGAGCSGCKSLYELVKTAVAELGIKAEVEYTDDISEIIKLGIMQAPVIVVDGKPVLTGSTNDIVKVKEILTKGNDTLITGDKPKCSCGGNC